MTDPAVPAPDDKNWTWVLDRPCPDCGFDPADHPRERFGVEIRRLAATYRTLLGHGRATERPAPEVWSALEYGCHVRDVFRRFGERRALMLNEDDPAVVNLDQDATAVEDRYWAQDPDKVAYDLAVAAGRLADDYDRIDGDQWARTGVRSDGSRFTVESLGRYLLHDPIHHVHDIEQGYERLAEAG